MTDLFQLLCGDTLEILRTMPASSVNCIVTSPPYWGLRDYGVDGQYGLEATPWEFVARMVEVFEECRRVLKKTGTCWINIGDSYAGGGRGAIRPGKMVGLSKHLSESRKVKVRENPSGLKAKDLIGMPWRVAFALQDAGWWLRRDIIWHKSNPMPESCTDRPATAHEYLFLLSKSKRYWYDREAILEPLIVGGSEEDYCRAVNSRRKVDPHRDQAMKVPQGWDISPGSHGTIHPEGRRKATPKEARAEASRRMGRPPGWRHEEDTPQGRNSRSVWKIATQPYPDAHFATFPEELPCRCILAGCPPGGVVLDPFVGSGTTVAVAIALGRRGIGIDLNPEYLELARKRINSVTPSLFMEDAS